MAKRSSGGPRLKRLRQLVRRANWLLVRPKDRRGGFACCVCGLAQPHFYRTRQGEIVCFDHVRDWDLIEPPLITPSNHVERVLLTMARLAFEERKYPQAATVAARLRCTRHSVYAAIRRAKRERRYDEFIERVNAAFHGIPIEIVRESTPPDQRFQSRAAGP